MEQLPRESALLGTCQRCEADTQILTEIQTSCAIFWPVCDENMEAELQKGEREGEGGRLVVVDDDDGDEVLTRAYFIALKCIPSSSSSASG